MFNHIHRPTPHASDGGRASQKGDGVGRWGEIASWRDGWSCTACRNWVLMVVMWLELHVP